MNTPTLYLELIILASGVFPSGFSNSLFASWRGTAHGLTTGFLSLLALPYPLIVGAVWLVRPELLVWRGTTVALLAVAVLLAPVALLSEYLIHAAALSAVSGRFPRQIRLQRFWRQRLSIFDYVMIEIIAIGEEIIYRGIWFPVLLSFHLPAPVAIALSSLVYGINHLAFGNRAALSKTVTGTLYCALYLFGGQSLWLPITCHTLQNLLLFGLAKERHA